MALTQVSTSGIKDATIATADIAADAITGAKIADDAINSEHYTDGSIDTAHIADSQVTTAKIAADAVTGAKIADDAVGSEHIEDLDGTVRFADNAKLGLGAHSGGEGDLNIWHNGSGNFIDTKWNLSIRKDDGDETLANFNNNGAVELYYDNSKKLETVSDGVQITGDLGLGVSPNDFGDARTFHIKGPSSEPAAIRLESGGDTADSNDFVLYKTDTNAYVRVNGTDPLRFYINGADRLMVTSAGLVKIENDTGKFTCGAGDDLQIYHNGSHSIIHHFNTGDLKLMPTTGDLIIDNGSGVLARVTQDGDVELPDNGEFRCGTGDDLKIYHDGSHSHILNATGNLRICADGAGELVLTAKSGEESIVCAQDGSVELMHDNSKKFETASHGVEVTGKLTFSGDGHTNGIELGADADIIFYHDNSDGYLDNNVGDLYLRNDGNSTSEKVKIQAKGGEESIVATADGNVELYHNGSKKFETAASGVYVRASGASGFWIDNEDDAGKDIEFIANADRLRFNDSVSASFGTSDDLRIFHDGSNSQIREEGTGDLMLITDSKINFQKASPGTNIAEFIVDGACNLYDNGSLRFNTHPNGIEIHSLTSAAGNADLRYNTSDGLVSYDTSTRLVKTDIIDVPYGLSVVNQLKPRKYKRTDSGDVEIGFIADEVSSLIPEIVPNIVKSFITKNEDDTDQVPFNVDYRKVCVVLTKAIQELSAKVTALEAE